MNPIVTVTVSQTVAPAPNRLQQTGAIISQGGTTLGVDGTGLITEPSDLTALLQGPIALASLTASGTTATATLISTTISSGTYNPTTGLVTLTLAATLGVAPGNLVTVSGVTGTGGYASCDGTFAAGVGTTGTTLTYAIAAALTMTITGGNAEATTGLANGATFLTTIAGATPAGYNGIVLATVASATTFTYQVPTGLSSATGSPTFTPPTVAELTQAVNYWFDQGANVAVYVLELGAGTPAQGVTALTSYITANPNWISPAAGGPGAFYAHLVPKSWSSETTFQTMVANYTALTKKIYFFTTMTLANYTAFANTLKCVFGWLDSPTAPVVEFGCAAAMRAWLANAPSTTNKVGPFAFTYLYGITPYPVKGNSALLSTLKTASVNVAGTGAEGGISNIILLWGAMMDGNGANYWYSADWIQVNGDLNLANAAINGSNNPINPLYYNQQGINTLQGVLTSTINQGLSYGLILFPPVQTALDGPALSQILEDEAYPSNTVVNAVPFITYSNENPSAYAAQSYSGLSVSQYIPQLGFISIGFNVQISTFVG